MRYCYGPVLSVYAPYLYYQMLILGILQLLTSASLLPFQLLCLMTSKLLGNKVFFDLFDFPLLL